MMQMVENTNSCHIMADLVYHDQNQHACMPLKYLMCKGKQEYNCAAFNLCN